MFTGESSLAEILVLADIAGASRMVPPASARISARLKRVQEHSSAENVVGKKIAIEVVCPRFLVRVYIERISAILGVFIHTIPLEAAATDCAVVLGSAQGVNLTNAGVIRESFSKKQRYYEELNRDFSRGNR